MCCRRSALPPNPELIQRFRDPVSEEEVDVADLLPHEVFRFMNLLRTGDLPEISPDEVIQLTKAYVSAGFPVPGAEEDPRVPTTIRKTDVVRVLGRNGAFTHSIVWALSKPASAQGGFIVQTVSFTERVTPPRGTEQIEQYFYQEAWHVRAGSVLTESYEQKLDSFAADMQRFGEDSYETPPYDDEFANDEGEEGVGQIIIAGQATFYDGMRELPADFVSNNADTIAGELPSRVGNNTDDLQGLASAAVNRMVWVQWNSNENDGATTLTKLV